jgi:hypothetical protein
VRARVCSVAVISHQGVQTEIRRVCSSFGTNMGGALPKIIKIDPWERERPQAADTVAVSQSLLPWLPLLLYPL